MMSRRSRPSLKSYTSIRGDESDDNDVFTNDTSIEMRTNENHDMENGEATGFTNTDNVVNPDVNIDKQDRKNQFCTRLKLIIIIGLSLIACIAVVGWIVCANTHNSNSPDPVKNYKTQSAFNKSEPKGVAVVPRVQCLLKQAEGPYNSTSNPLQDICIPGSQFVQQYCPKDHSKHQCTECSKNGEYLPNMCFCDVGLQCEDPQNEHLRKQNCTWCKENCPCLNNGTCSCPLHPSVGTELNCSCPTGYGGKYCEIVSVRICSNDLTKTENLEQCDQRSKSKCGWFSEKMKANLTCTIVSDTSIAQALENCNMVEDISWKG